MELMSAIEVAAVAAIVGLCGAHVWRRFRATAQGLNTTCGCDRTACAACQAKTSGDGACGSASVRAGSANENTV